MLERWVKEIEEGIKAAAGMEKEAQIALKKAKGKVPDEIFKKALSDLEIGQGNMNIVRYGNGVHNKKYALMLMNETVILFEDLIDALEEGK